MAELVIPHPEADQEIDNHNVNQVNGGLNFGHIIHVLGNILLLPLRLLNYLVSDIKDALFHAFIASRECIIGLVFLVLIIALLAVESFGENLFLGDVLPKILPDLDAYVPESGVIGALLSMAVPIMSEMRSAVIVAFSISLSSIASMALFLFYYEEHHHQHYDIPIHAQEPLLLQDQIEESVDEPDEQQQPNKTVPTLFGMIIGGGVLLIISFFELMTFPKVFTPPILGILNALLLLALRLITGYLTHLLLKRFFSNARLWMSHFTSAIKAFLQIIPNFLAKALELIEAAFQQ
jgi:hypothetical protein